MGFIFKDRLIQQIFEKDRLKDILCIGMVFQVYHAHPPHGIGIPSQGIVYLLVRCAYKNSVVVIGYRWQPFPRALPRPELW